MEQVTVDIGDTSKTYDLKTISRQDNIGKVKFFSSLDKMMATINKKKYHHSKEILSYLKELRAPRLISKESITLISLLNYFQKKYVYKTFTLDLNKYPETVQNEIGYREIEIATKPNNFPHLIGIKGQRDAYGDIIDRENVKEFLDGVLYQWILLNAHDGFDLDYEKLAVLHWIYPTLTNPTYILPQSAIKRNGNTKFDADLIFVKRIHHSQTHAFHIVGLKQEKNSTYAFKSQFAISKEREQRFYAMFEIKKAIFDFFRK